MPKAAAALSAALQEAFYPLTIELRLHHRGYTLVVCYKANDYMEALAGLTLTDLVSWTVVFTDSDGEKTMVDS